MCVEKTRKINFWQSVENIVQFALVNKLWCYFDNGKKNSNVFASKNSQQHSQPLKITFLCNPKVQRRGKFHGSVTELERFLGGILERIPKPKDTLII